MEINRKEPTLKLNNLRPKKRNATQASQWREISVFVTETMMIYKSRTNKAENRTIYLYQKEGMKAN
jgi:hypothetical protein